MARVLRVQRGGIVPVRLPFREIRSDSLNGQRVNVNGVSATILNPDGTTSSTIAALDREQLGTYILYWDTSGLSGGDYRLRIRFGYAFRSAISSPSKVGEKDIILRLVNAV